MNPHAAHSTSLLTLVSSLWQHRHLIKVMVIREVVGRYKGSIFGLAWSLLNPLMMLTIYTFVFSVVFKARWGIKTTDNTSDFALILFVGLIIHSLFAEVLNRAPSLILSNANYVKKIVFPLEMLSVVNIGASLFHALISMFVLLVALILLNGMPTLTIIYTPITLLPLLPITLGISWFLASLGVYLRDIGQMIGIVTTVLLFLAPVFYPIEALPESYQMFLHLNPLTFPIEQTRTVIIYSEPPNWIGQAVYTIFSIVTCRFGFWWFQKTRKGFSDVI
ncbi:ABC transporter permease [Salinisphaera sp. G21_0]|uniref:ABC transporter permease n=1 Tax=Salinisphaera sp. G21_0 TaxID=2821094 RepID=UPI001ADC06C0|nr:ABC transporter permease [Salinisphaera sp. G21_0]MBO9484014.1 ABC transporter permease [Salinisphaera sp. G21_0]